MRLSDRASRDDPQNKGSVPSFPDKITDRTLLSNYLEIDWKGAKGLRDILSHHYFDLDAEQIFWVCTNRMRPLGETLEKIIADLEQGSNER